MKKILFIGASFSERFFIKKAKELGYYVIAIDPDEKAAGFANANQKIVMSLSNREGCLSIAQINHVNGVFGSAAQDSCLTASYIASTLNLPGIKYNVAEALSDHLQVRHLFYGSYIDDLSHYHVLHSLKDLFPLSATINFPVLLKYPFTYQQFGYRIHSMSELLDRVIFASQQQENIDVLIEEYKEGEDYVIELFVYQGEAFILGILEKQRITDTGEVNYTFPVKVANNPKIHDLIQNTLNILAIDFGPVSIEVILTEDGEAFILNVHSTINADYLSSHIIPKALRYDYPANLLKATVSDALDLPPYRYSRNVYTRILPYSRDVNFTLNNLDKLEKSHRVKIELNPEGLYIIGAEESLTVAKNNVNAAVEQITEKVVC